MSSEFETIYQLIESKTFYDPSKNPTYNYKTILDEPLTDLYELSLVDYQINLPENFDVSNNHPFILLKVNDFELVKHNKVPKIFKTIPTKKPCDTNVCHHSTVKLSNSDCNISQIHIQICNLDGNFLEDIKDCHNSFLFRGKRKIQRTF